MKILFYCGIHNLVNFSRIRSYYDVCYGFDANPEKIDQARKFYANDPNVKIVFGALTEKGGEEIEFVITNDWTPASSLGNPNPDFVHMKTGLLQSQKKIRVPTINLHDFCKVNGIMEIDTLITDLQGIDFTVLQTMTEMIRQGKIREIQCEVEPDQTPARYLGIPTGKLHQFNELLSEQYDVLWMDPENPQVAEGAWEMDVRWRRKGGYPSDGLEFFIEKELLVAKIHSCSQYREDLVIDALFKHKPAGFYVDIGANDPDVMSNTKLFYERGWRGINVEPDPDLHDKLCQKRNLDINLKCGIGTKPGLMTFYKMSANTLSSFNKEAALHAGMLYDATPIGEEMIPVSTMSDILSQHLDGQTIDFLSVDAEGYDLAVLQSNDWSRYRPSVIIVEINVGGDDIVSYLQKLNYILIFDNGTNGIFIANEFSSSLDDPIRKDISKLEQIHGLRTVLPDQERLTLNIVYGHMQPNQITSQKRGNVNILWSALPIEGCDHYIFHNAFSFRGRLPGMNILLMLEPAVVLPGEFSEEVWKHFDHLIGLFDFLEGQKRNFYKILFPRADVAGKNPVTEIQSQRESLYPLFGRKNAICMIGSNRSSHVPHELYSKRVEIARWFAEHSRMPFDVYGTPFDLPNYRGPCPVSQKLSVLKQYRYNLCFENTNDPILSAGYVTEKILDCMESRTIPIYLGASNIEKYVPKECFIDMREFANYGDLDDYLRNLSDKEYQRYVSAIDHWVNAGGLNQFSSISFFEALTKICAEASYKSTESLYDGKDAWVEVSPQPPTARLLWKFFNTPIMWTWKHLSNAEPPKVIDGKILRENINIDSSRDESKKHNKTFPISGKPFLKILMAGTTFSSGNARRGYDYVWWNMYDTLCRFTNIQTQFFDCVTEAQNSGIAGMSDRLTAILRKEKPDILFYVPGNVTVRILSESLKAITDSSNARTIVWLDDLNQYGDMEAGQWSSCADHIITTSPESFYKLQNHGFGRQIIRSQWAFNPFTYRHTSTSKTRNISFIGSICDNRSLIIDQIQQRGLTVDVFGSGWHEDSFISFYDMVSILGQSRINLNLCDPKGSIRRRAFEAPGCRGFLLTMPSKELENYYDPGKEIVVASSLEELVNQAKYYLSHETERKIIAERGYQRTMAEHTWTRRFTDIFKQIGFAAIPSKSVDTQSLPIQSLPRNILVTETLKESGEDIPTSIVVMGYNKLEYTKQCVESILQYTKGPYELILTDNGSTDGTLEYYNWVRNFHSLTRVIKHFTNRNVEALGNYVFSLTRGKYIVGVANDALVHEGWLETLIRHMEANPDAGIIGTRSNSISGPQAAPSDYSTLEGFHTFAAQWSNQHRGEAFPIQRVVGIVGIMKRAVIERIGNVDPDLPVNGRDGGYGFSDDDFSIRLLLAGYKPLIANDVFIHHFGSVTTKQYRPDLFGAPQNLNQEKYFRKLRKNDRIVIGTDGKLSLKPYSLEEPIRVDERTAIQTPRICFIETSDHQSILSESTSDFTPIVSKLKKQIVQKTGEPIYSLLLNMFSEKHYDFLVLRDMRITVAPEILPTLAESALCHPDVAIMVPVADYAPSTHRQPGGGEGVELIPYADLSVCVLNLKIIRSISAGLNKCQSDDDMIWFLQRRIQGEGYFIGKANGIVIKSNRPTSAHPYDGRKLPEQFIKEKEYGQAVEIYEDDLRKDSNFAYAYYQLACIAHEQGQTLEAIRRGEQALEADPHHIETLILLSTLHMDNNKWKKAQSFVSQANFKQPGHPDVQKIVARYEKVIKENPALLKSEENKEIPQLTKTEFVKNRISIIITAKSEHVFDCAAAIKKCTKESYELIVLDRFKDTKEKKKLKKNIKEHRHHKIIEHHPEKPLLPAINKAINESSGEYIVLLEDDVLVKDGCLTGMLSCLNNTDNGGIIGPLTNSSRGIQQIDADPLFNISKLNQNATNYKAPYRHRRIPCRNLDGFCMLFRRSLAARIGLLDERFETMPFQDEDICIRAALASYQNYIAGDVFVRRRKIKSAPYDRRILEDKWTFIMADAEGKKLALLKAIEYAEILHSKGQDNQAVEALVNCIKFAPDTKEIYFELARIFIESKKFSEAWEVIETMPEEAKSSIKGLELAGYAREGLGLDNEAMDFANNILSSDRSNPSALNLKGILAFKKDQIGEALDYFKRSIQSDPGFGEPYVNLGVLYWKMGKKEEALEHLRKGFILSPNVPDHCNIYYSVLSTSEEFRRAKDDFGEANRLYPHNKHIAFLYIDILIRQANLDEAMIKIEDALASFGPEEGLLNAALSVREKIGPRQIDPSLKRGTLSFCLIVKNEEKYLVNCLKSIRDIADEIIIVDTGSTDKTVDIAKVFGARLFFYSWIGDFSAARNHSLEQAKGDWIFVLDADEVISSVDYEEIKSIISKRPTSPEAYLVNTRNYLTSEFVVGRQDYDGKYPEESRLGWISSGKVRLFTRREEIFFVNPVHELLEPSIINARIPLHNSNIAVHHYGKLDTSKEAQKGEEYYLMGKIKCENEPTNIRYIIELAKQAQLLSKNEEALELFRKALALLGDDRESPAFKDLTLFAFGEPIEEIQAYIAATCLHLNRFEEALEASHKSLKTNLKLKEYITIHAQCEILAGSLDQALSLIEEQLQITPDYVPAIIFKAAVLCMKGKDKELKELSPLMLQNRDQVATVFKVLTTKLHQNNMQDKALRLASAAFDTQIITEETHNILQLLDKKLSSQT